MRKCSVTPYEGEENYIFVSYCHKDKKYVFPIIEQLAKDGYRIWYDEGIDPGSEWPEIIAYHLSRAASVIAFITENSLNSHNCRREINFALLKKKPFISIFLEEVILTPGVEMQLGSAQSIFKYMLTNEEFFKSLYRAESIKQCLGTPNPEIVVSSADDYKDERNGVFAESNKKRDTFSDKWFVDEKPGFAPVPAAAPDVEPKSETSNIPPAVDPEPTPKPEKSEKTPPAPAPKPQPVSKPKAEPMQKNTSKRGVNIFLVIGIVILAVILIFVLLRGCIDESNENSTDVSVDTETSETVSDNEISTDEISDEVSAECSTPEESIPAEHTHAYANSWSSNETDHWYECECGEKSDIANHTFGEWETTKEATEDATGSKKHTCSVCGYEETATIPMLSHTHEYSNEWSSNETDHWKECKCGDKSGVTSHTYGDWTVTKEATEETEGSKHHTCSACSYKETVKIPVLSHTHKYGDWKNNATSHWKECECGDKSGMSAHAYGDWVIIKDATCTETGTKKHTCTACGYSETATIPVIAHTYGDWKTNATSHWKECKCGDKTQLSTHTYGAWETTKEATCTATGTKKHTCTACSYSETSTVPVIAHTYSDWKNDSTNHWKECMCGNVSEKANHNYTSVVTPPTSGAQGYTTHTCGACGYSYVDSYTEFTGAYSQGLGYKVNDDGVTCTITGIGTCLDAYLNIPPMIDGYKVTTIGNEAFKNRIQLKGVTIPNGVTKIGTRAFKDCFSLTNITIPVSVTEFNGVVFSECRSISNVYYQGNIADWLSISFKSFDSNPCAYGSNLYFNNVLVTDLTIPDGTTEIKQYAFTGVESLTDITIPASVTGFGTMAFRHCKGITNVYYQGNVEDWLSIFFKSETNPCTNGSNLYFNNVLVTNLTIPDGTTTIKQYAFRGVKSLNGITIPSSVTTIESYAFEKCGLTSITIPASVSAINSSTFAECVSLDSVTIPNSVTTIKDRAFENCEKLTSISIPSSVIEIGYHAFSCSGLTSVTIPESVTTISNTAFNECPQLANIIVDKKNPKYYNEGNCLINKDRGMVIWGCENSVIPAGVVRIGSLAFQGCTNLTNIIIPDGVVSIGQDAFHSCTGLVSVTIPKSVTNIDQTSFTDCPALADIYYSGTAAEWASLVKGKESYSPALFKATIHYI